jgi:PucR C-terminal helix-turn-helix domain
VVATAPRPWQEVPEEIAPRLRPRIPPLVSEVIAAVRREVPEYDQPLEGRFGRFISGGVGLALEQFVDLLGTPADLPDTSPYEEMGRAELEAGRTLDALQSAYRTGARVAWRQLASDLHAELDPRVMYTLAEAIFVYIDRLADASVAGYSNALAAREGSAQARRQSLVALLVAGPVTPEELAEAARLAQWSVPQAVRVVACDHEDPPALARTAPSATLGARTDDGSWLIVPDPEGPGRAGRLAEALAGVLCAVGPAVPVTRAPLSANRAAQALALLEAGELPDVGPAWTDEHRVALLLAADRELAAEMIDARLRPLAGLAPKARARAEETLAAWLAAHGDVSVAAELLHVHAQTVRYRLGTLRELLGDGALDDPTQRLELALAMAAPPSWRPSDA